MPGDIALRVEAREVDLLRPFLLGRLVARLEADHEGFGVEARIPPDLVVDLAARPELVARLAVGQFDLGPAAAFSLVYFLVILLLSYVFYTAMNAAERGRAP